jgi:hypothetical protein
MKVNLGLWVYAMTTKRHSPGNTRTSRIGVREFVTVPGKGQYVKYDSWRTGTMDACYRLVDPVFQYVKAGAKTIEKILPVWAPASDSNSPARYISSVVDLMNQWSKGGGEMPLKIALSSGHHNSMGVHRLKRLSPARYAISTLWLSVN